MDSIDPKDIRSTDPYVKVRWHDVIGYYRLTSSYTDEPYIKVSNSYLPVTTNTTNLIAATQPKIEVNGTLCRPLRIVSSSSSTTCYTTAYESSDLEDVTALTRESTSGTSYLTRESTSGTSYLTSNKPNERLVYVSKASLTFSGTNSSRASITRYTQTISDGGRLAYSYSESSTRTYVNIKIVPLSPGSYSASEETFSKPFANQVFYWYEEPGQYWATYLKGGTYTGQETASNYWLIAFGSYNSGTAMSKIRWAKIEQTAANRSITHNKAEISNLVYSFNNTINMDSYVEINSYSLKHGEVQRLRAYVRKGGVVTTGTSYLTCSSTSGTSYLTCSSTSAYSGISSSSTSAQGGWV